ncbi:MAG: hypothetical protein ACRED5_12310 [Propylenella sp.]
MEDILARLRREDRRRTTAANAVLACLFSFVVILFLFGGPDEGPIQLAPPEPKLAWLHVNR